MYAGYGCMQRNHMYQPPVAIGTNNIVKMLVLNHFYRISYFNDLLKGNKTAFCCASDRCHRDLGQSSEVSSGRLGGLCRYIALLCWLVQMPVGQSNILRTMKNYKTLIGLASEIYKAICHRMYIKEMLTSTYPTLYVI